MAANKFATMLHRNTHRMTLVLVYAVLEWVLIILLLLNSLLSYLIVKFAEYFGLKPPCLWCSRVDHIFEPDKRKNFYRDLVCGSHATEISNLGFCANHQKLAQAQDMCEDCSSSQPNCHGNSSDFTRTIALFSWVKEMGMIPSDGEKNIENGETNLRCSCCDVRLSSKFYSPYLLFKPSWDVLDYPQKGNFVTAAPGGDYNGGENSDLCKSDSPTDHCDDERETETDRDEEEEEDQMLFDFNEFSHRTEEEEEDCLRSPSNFPCQERDGDEDESLGAVQITEKDPLESDDSDMSMEGTDDTHRSTDETMIQVCCIEDASFEMIPLHSENCADHEDQRLVPIELIDYTTAANQFVSRRKKEDQGKNGHQEESLDSELQIETRFELAMETRSILGETVAGLLAAESERNTKIEKLEAIEMEKNESSSSMGGQECKEDITGRGSEEIAITQANKEMFEAIEMEKNEISSIMCGEECKEDITGRGSEEIAITQATEAPLNDECAPESTAEAVTNSEVLQASQEDSFKIWDGENKQEILTGSEISEAHEHIPSEPCMEEDPLINDYNAENSTSSSGMVNKNNDQGPKQVEDESLSVPVLEQGINHHLKLSADINEAEDEKLPETPSYIEGLHNLHKKLLLLEKKESGTEESLDGSVMSELEGCEGTVTIDHLKSALKAERKVLHALYAELEEERSASAVAANQTMAMITRLQEEKAAMQMEALQYQRMMEEQSEYDQEALQLLNELMVKREKENQELEKELDIFRKKVIDYEAKEKRMMRRKYSNRSRISSASSSNAEDSDGVSIDLNHDGRDEDSFDNHQEISNHYTPADAVVSLEGMGLECAKHLTTLDESLAYFEEERMSILEQLKTLEEKLFTLADDDDEFFEDVKPIEHFTEENGKELANGFTNDYSEELDERHFQERTMASKGKRLLPLFDAIGMESENGVLHEDQEGPVSVLSRNSSISKSELEKNKRAIEEEVDHVYGRLQALEEDREFLKHCISSLRKGDKGMGLLQEILQHLRDLRTVELRVRNMSDGALE